METVPTPVRSPLREPCSSACFIRSRYCFISGRVLSLVSNWRWQDDEYNRERGQGDREKGRQRKIGLPLSPCPLVSPSPCLHVVLSPPLSALSVWLTGSGWLGRVLTACDRRRIFWRQLQHLLHINVSI